MFTSDLPFGRSRQSAGEGEEAAGGVYEEGGGAQAVLGPHGRGRERRLCEQKGGKVEAKPKEVETIDTARWSDLVCNYGGNSNPSAPAGVISTHRRPSNGTASYPQANADNVARVRAPGAPTRTQSAHELYANYPLFVGPVVILHKPHTVHEE
ncbi:hypothetical protein DFH11DRAFT_1733842 [Phellopilus nigrolimitatus]|nr:hypothetical protein DFH11DRAFT_1733842 [Phellopilus nigrolimitatus]